MPPRVVLITGCSSGIGAASARAFCAEGWAVYATARRPESLSGLAASPGVTPLALDVLDEDSMVSAVKQIEVEHGAIDVLVNNAGYALQAPVEEAAMADIRKQFETNVFGPVRLTQLVLPAMRARRSGRIINLSSMGGRFTFPGGAFYHASKHAVEAISDALRLEVAPFGVRVSIIEPGPVLTEFAAAAVDTMDTMDDEGEAAGPYDDFKRRLAETYHDAYSGGSTKLASSSESVAKTILKAATVRRPRPRYVVGPIAHALINSRRMLPDRAFDVLMRSQWPTP